MPTLIIQRKTEFANRGRKFEIFVDDKSKGIIANGETKRYKITQGQHQITAKVDWCSSKTLTVDFTKNSTKTLMVSSFKFANILMPVGLILAILHIILRYTIHFDYLIYPVGFFFLFLIYLLTLGRKHYLRLYLNQ